MRASHTPSHTPSRTSSRTLRPARLAHALALTLASCVGACVFVQAPPVAQPAANVTARVTVSVGPRLGAIPDVPTVAGTRVDERIIHATLDARGRWAADARYGHVWFPDEMAVSTAFVPYGTHGHWVPTDAGWYWQSELPWGWLTFHYGRWVSVSGRWAWVPGALFAPAWVEWRTGGAWAGWAPLPPQGAMIQTPFAFCPITHLAGGGLWSRVVYGPSSASLYAATVALPPSAGYHGAVYAHGPSAPGVGRVPVSAAYATSATVANGGRAGAPSSGGAQGYAGATPGANGGRSGRSGASGGEGDGTVQARPGAVLDGTQAGTMAGNGALAEVSYGGADAPSIRRPTVRLDDGAANGTEGASLIDTEDLPRIAIEPRRPLRETVSLGTTDPVLPAASVLDPVAVPTVAGTRPEPIRTAPIVPEITRPEGPVFARPIGPDPRFDPRNDPRIDTRFDTRVDTRLDPAGAPGGLPFEPRGPIVARPYGAYNVPSDVEHVRTTPVPMSAPPAWRPPVGNVPQPVYAAPARGFSAPSMPEMDPRPRYAPPVAPPVTMQPMVRPMAQPMAVPQAMPVPMAVPMARPIVR